MPISPEWLGVAFRDWQNHRLYLSHRPKAWCLRTPGQASEIAPYSAQLLEYFEGSHWGFERAAAIYESQMNLFYQG